MKILVNTSIKARAHKGGVNNHWWGLYSYWTERVKYNTYGKRIFNTPGSSKLWFPFDIFKYVFVLLFWRPDVVIVNPSIAKNALKREFFYVKVTQWLKRKIIVFIHGFNLDNYSTLNKDSFVKSINSVSGVIVLANQFKKILQNDGVNVPIEILTTKVDDRLIEKFDISKRKGDINNILFLARIERAKGIYETIDVYMLLKKQFSQLTLTLVGAGTELDNVRKHIADNDVKDVNITGALKGDSLVSAFEQADIYLFPSYGEGMPTSVLEAMAFGLPVFTRNVGGLPDVFINGKMGYITDSLNPNDYAEEIAKYIMNPDLTKSVSLYNYNYAKEHFMASKVAIQTQNAIKRILENDN